MWNWIRRDSPSPATPSVLAAPDPPPAAPRGQLKAGPYRLLHEYLRKRYADTVVLTFDRIEDLLGFTLPTEARAMRSPSRERAISKIEPCENMEGVDIAQQLFEMLDAVVAIGLQGTARLGALPRHGFGSTGRD